MKDLSRFLVTEVHTLLEKNPCFIHLALNSAHGAYSTPAGRALNETALTFIDDSHPVLPLDAGHLSSMSSMVSTNEPATLFHAPLWRAALWQ